MERMGRDHGRCRADGDVVPLSRAHGRFRLRCERGAIEFVAFLTPGLPQTIQMVEWRQELPVGDTELATAGRLASVMNRAGPLPPELLSPDADRALLERRLARLRGAFGTCEIDRPLWKSGDGETSVRLRCTEGPADLSFRLDPKTSRVADFSGARPRAFGAICTE
jgi:hypothetical protein